MDYRIFHDGSRHSERCSFLNPLSVSLEKTHSYIAVATASRSPIPGIMSNHIYAPVNEGSNGGGKVPAMRI